MSEVEKLARLIRYYIYAFIITFAILAFLDAWGFILGADSTDGEYKAQRCNISERL